MIKRLKETIKWWLKIGWHEIECTSEYQVGGGIWVTKKFFNPTTGETRISPGIPPVG